MSNYQILTPAGVINVEGSVEWAALVFGRLLEQGERPFMLCEAWPVPREFDSAAVVDFVNAEGSATCLSA